MSRNKVFLLSLLALFGCYGRSELIRFSIGNKNYVQLTKQMTWKEGHESCVKLGGLSVAINDGYENYSLAHAVLKSEGR